MGGGRSEKEAETGWELEDGVPHMCVYALVSGVWGEQGDRG